MMDILQTSRLDPVLEDSPLGTEKVSVQEVNLERLENAGKKKSNFVLFNIYFYARYR